MLQQNHSRSHDARRGSSMVEFSLVFTILLTLVLGIFELGRTIWNYNTIAYAARQASRYASVRSNLGDPNYTASPNPIDSVVLANAVGLDPSRLTVTKSWLPDNSRGSRVQITVSYPIDLIASPIFVGRDNRVNVSATSTLTILN
jgi:Flp pilus assembly protein TadG